MGLTCKMEICLGRASASNPGSVMGHPGPESPINANLLLPFMERNSCCLVLSECL